MGNTTKKITSWFTGAASTVVKVKKVRQNGVIVYDLDSILESAPAKRHIHAIHKWIEAGEIPTRVHAK